MRNLRAAVVGAGSMGRHHIRLLHAQPDVDLVAVVDSDPAAARMRAAGTSAEVLSSLAELPEIDVAVVATPTHSHAGIANELIARGVHLLVEKPVASTPEESEALAAAARAAGLVLAVGHVERFNPAFALLATLTHDPRMLSFERLSPYTPRIGDSVVMDMMVHDIDLALWILGSYPIRVEAVGCRVFSDTIDVASAILEFPDDRIAVLQSSRATQDKVRRVSVSEPERFIFADSIRQDVSVKRETEVEFLESGGHVSYRQANVVEVPYLDRTGEPLAREIRDFVDAVRDGRDPLATGEAGAAVVRLARQIEAQLGS